MKSFMFTSVVAVVLTATIAHAQISSDPEDKVKSWTIGADIAPGGWVHIDGLEPVGLVAGKPIETRQQKDALISIFGGYKPVGKVGGEVRFTRMGAHGSAAGSGQDTVMWGTDVAPFIISSAPILAGSRAYTASTSASFRRVDLAVNRTWELNEQGWLSAFGGLSFVNIESQSAMGQEQKFLLYARLPSGAIDPRGDREIYRWGSVASNTYHGLGPMFGAEGEYCIIGGVIVEGRAAVAFLPWGSAKSAGQFTFTKDVDLVDVAGGVNAPSVLTLAHLNLAPGAGTVYTASTHKTVTVFDFKGAVKYRFRGERVSGDVGLGVVKMVLSGVPGTPGYVIPPTFAAGAGKWGSRQGSLAMWAPVLTFNIWF